MTKIEHTKRKTSRTFIISGLILSVLLVSSSLLFLLYPFPSKDKISYSEKSNPIIINSDIYKDEILVEDGHVYFPLSFIQEKIDDSIILDEESNSIILTTSDKVYQMSSDSLTLFVNEDKHQLQFPIYKMHNNLPYISIEPLQSLYQVEYKFSEETGITVVRSNGEKIRSGKIKKNNKEYELRLRSGSDLTAPYVSEILPNENIIIEREVEDFYYIRKENGIAGYIKKSSIDVNETITIEIKAEDRIEVQLKHPTLPINLTWEAVYTVNPNTSKLPTMPGLNVVSPTWFALKNNEGDVENLGATSYVEWAKTNGYQVWGVFSNDFDPGKTHEAFKSFETRKKIIRQLLEYSKMYNLDGINFDIENVNVEDGPFVTQLIKEATPYLHEAGLVVSMDITFISTSGNWSGFYERDKLASVVDYMMVMAYDEHWGTSPVAGSVASLPWVENNLINLLEVVPNEKLVLGMPLYSRIWKEADTEGGNIEVSSKAYSMAEIQKWISERNLTPTYDENSGQNYVEYRDEKEKATYKIWIEDELSLNKRVMLMHKYELAGVATWSRFFANEEAWNAISQSISDSKEVNK